MYLLQEKEFVCMCSVEGYRDKESAKISLSRPAVHAYNKNHEFDKIKHVCGFMQFIGTADSLINLLITGHTIIPGTIKPYGFGDGYDLTYLNKRNNTAPAFFKSGKYKGSIKPTVTCEKFVSSSQVIALDIDDTDYKDIQSVCDKLTFKPTFGIYTFSDTPDKRRMRSEEHTS